MIHGQTYHFGKVHTSSTRGIRSGETQTRWIPWSQIAVVTELPTNLDWRHVPFKLNKDSRLVPDTRRESPSESKVDAV